MDCSFTSFTHSSIVPNSIAAKHSPLLSSPISAVQCRKLCGERRATSFGGCGLRRVKGSRCKIVSSSSLNTPIEPRTGAGRYLSGVLQNDRGMFDKAVTEELRRLRVSKEAAVARMVRSVGSDEESIHRRIAELKGRENQTEVEDIMYMSIVYKFSDINVHLVPQLSRCIYNGRLEICPSKDWELESIYSNEVLELIREHVSSAIGLKASSSVSDSWAITQIQQAQFAKLYVASIFFGYFLKSASLRHHLEQSLALSNREICLYRPAPLLFPQLQPLLLKTVSECSIKKTGYGSASQHHQSYLQGMGHETLRCYVMGLDQNRFQRWTKLKSKEAMNLVHNHTVALFGSETMGTIETDKTKNAITTSFSSLKRFVLEALAFGHFLWDTEVQIDTMYKLQEN